MSGLPVTLGYLAALRVLDAGRAAFFGTAEADLPVAQTPEIGRDDALPQFGFVGQGYGESRLLIIAINPGNGPRDRRDPRDEIALPALERFVKERTQDSFGLALQAYQRVCPGWSIWRQHGMPVVRAAGLTLDQVAYANCLPWRTLSESGFSDPAARKSVELYVKPLLSELTPRVVVALGKKAAQVLELVQPFHAEFVVWNRARAPTTTVVAERTAAAARLSALFGPNAA
jgi:hypothetical protein